MPSIHPLTREIRLNQMEARGMLIAEAVLKSVASMSEDHDIANSANSALSLMLAVKEQLVVPQLKES